MFISNCILRLIVFILDPLCVELHNSDTVSESKSAESAPVVILCPNEFKTEN